MTTTPDDVLCARLIRGMQTTHQVPAQAELDKLNGWRPTVEALAGGLREDGLPGLEKVLATLTADNQRLRIVLATVGTGEAAQEDLFTFLEFGDLRKLPKPKWLVYQFLPTKGINFIFGPAGEGKTFLVTGLAATVASTGLQWMERSTRHGHVIYIAAEDIDEVAQRFIGWSIYHDGEDLSRLHIYPDALQLVNDTDKLIASIDKRYGAIDIAMIVVDTMAMCTLGIEENSAKEYGRVIASLEALWRKYDCCVVAVHHSGRSGEKMRGSSAMDGAGYSATKITKEDELIKIHCDKMRRGKRFDDFLLDWETVELPDTFDEMGEPLTVGVLVPTTRSAQADPTRLTPLQTTVLKHLEALGGKDVPQPEIRDAMGIERRSRQENDLRTAVKLLHRKGYVTPYLKGQTTIISLAEKQAGS